MRINPINITKYNYNIYTNHSGNQKRNNMSPLACDTVSFTSRAEFIPEYMRYAPSSRVCRNVQENAKPAMMYLKKVLDKYISPFSENTNMEKNEPPLVYTCTTRIKKPYSIREKVVSKFTKRVVDESDKFTERLFDDLSQNFKINPDCSQDDIKYIIQRTTAGIVQDKKVPLFQNASYLLPEIIDDLDKLNCFDFDSVPQNAKKLIFQDMIEAMENEGDNDSVVDNHFILPETEEGVKHYAQDIVGGRIILSQPDPKYTVPIINAIKDAVINKELKILSIETNVPDPKRLPKGAQVSDYIYATDSQLRKLAKIADAEFIKNESKSGYMAIHINIDLSGDLFSQENSIYDGYKGEIQIIGKDVEQLKNIEDLCYKLKDNKNILDTRYEPFKKHFIQYYNDDNKDAFDDYTYALYLAQRKLPASKHASTSFPSIKDLGFEGKVPEELDFNVLRAIKIKCEKEGEKSDNDNNQTVEPKLSNLLDLKNIKAYISYKIHR